eukprot:TRINITY_DN29495_c0_g1_i2.p1 TRINITY_DN29495_c0_g1~~TRINITY_DN29495_c0_g1_i2.p1  ORF type:complete len:128 (-),score=0.01 TRINITY_DN29495_c0_g1_i2:124-507(-)
MMPARTTFLPSRPVGAMLSISCLLGDGARAAPTAPVTSRQVPLPVEQLFILMRVANTRNMFLLFRTLRLIRISRLIRMFRLVDELQKIVSSILGSMDSLAWVLLLLVIIIYLFSVVFTQLLCHPELG